VIGDEIKSTKVARFNVAAKFREKTVKKLFIFFAKLTFFHAGQREKKSFFHAKITFFHAAASSVKKSDSSVKKSTFFHVREKVIKSRICMFRGGWEIIKPT
jgi:hypothetical protein